MRNECFALEILQGECFDLSVGGEVCETEVHVLGIFFGAVHEDDRERVALVADGTVGGHQRVVAGGGLHAVRVAVAAEQVHRFVHAVAPCPRGENLDPVVLHGSEERRVSERRDHRVVFVNQACFGDAERDSVTFAEVLLQPVVDAYEDVLLGNFIVPAATYHLDPVCSGIVIGGVE